MNYLTEVFTTPPIKITIDQCAAIITKTTADTIAPMAGGLVLFMVVAVLFAILWALEVREHKLMKDFMRREDKLNKYENWKKDRQLIQE